jgi:hypothetical protein
MKYLYGLIAFMVCTFFAAAQVPGGINYQGVGIDQYTLLLNKPIVLRFTIREKSTNGAAIFSETRDATTDSSGVFNVVIGGSGAKLQSGDIRKVTWSDSTRKFLQVEMNIKPHLDVFVDMGTTQLLSVPFSFYSDISDSAKYAKGSGNYFFSASLQPGVVYPLTNSASYSPLLLTAVNKNEGNAYKVDSSVFVAPDSGMYQFDFNAVWIVQEGERIDPENYNDYLDVRFAITKNGQIVKQLFNNAYDVQYYISCRLELVPGDRIALKKSSQFENLTGNIITSPFGLLPGTNESFSEFSGYKIR